MFYNMPGTILVPLHILFTINPFRQYILLFYREVSGGVMMLREGLAVCSTMSGSHADMSVYPTKFLYILDMCFRHLQLSDTVSSSLKWEWQEVSFSGASSEN